MKQPRERACVFIDFSGEFKLAQMTVAAGVKPTHWYTPTQHSPRDFWRARAWEISDRSNCWQYRTKLSTRTLYTPDHGVNIIVNALGPRRRQIRKFCDDHGILPEFGVFFYTEGMGYSGLHAEAGRGLLLGHRRLDRRPHARDR